MLVGVGVVAITAVLAKIFMSKDKKKKGPVTLADPNIKYPLKLVDKEVRLLRLYFFADAQIAQSMLFKQTRQLGQSNQQ